MNNFRKDLVTLLNSYNNGALSETPDGILAEFLQSCVKAWDETQKKQTKLIKREKFRKEAKVFSFNRLA
jgi:hypothetical protein